MFSKIFLKKLSILICLILFSYTFTSLASAAKEDSYIKPLNILFKKNFGGEDSDKFYFATEAKGGIIAVGTSSPNSFNTSDWTNIAGNGNNDAVIVKYDTLGNIIWKHNFGGSGYDEYFSIAKASDGYVAVGYSESFESGDWNGIISKGSHDAIIVKYNESGNIVWKRNFGGLSNDCFNSVTVLSDGYLAVGYSNIASFNNGDFLNITGKGGNDATIAKFDFSGNLIWTRNFGGSQNDVFNSVNSTSDGFICAGYSQSFNSGDWTDINGKGLDDAIIVKYDNDGNIIFKKNFGGVNIDRFRSVTSIPDGYLAVGSASENSFNTNDFINIIKKGNYDGIIVKFDLSGNVIWVKNFGGQGNDGFHFIKADSDGYIAAGYSYISSFGNGDWIDISGRGDNDAILIKYDANGNILRKNSFGGSNIDHFYSLAIVNNNIYAVGTSHYLSFNSGDWIDVLKKGNINDDATVVKFFDSLSAPELPVVINSYGLYNGQEKIEQLPDIKGTYTFKAQCFNETPANISALIILAIKDNNKNIKTYITPEVIAFGNALNFEQEVKLPSVACAPNLELKLMIFSSFLEIKPLSMPISIKR